MVLMRVERKVQMSAYDKKKKKILDKIWWQREKGDIIGWKFVFLPNSYVGALTLKAMVFGDGDLWKLIGLEERWS